MQLIITALVLTLALVLTTTADASSSDGDLDTRTSVRDMDAMQIIGDYVNIPLDPSVSSQCPDAINVTRVETIQSPNGVLYVIPHRYITLPQTGGTLATCQGTALTSDIAPESATVLRRDTQLPLDRNNSVVDAFATAQERFFIGVELGPRVCGLLTLDAGAVSMWMAPARSIMARVLPTAFSVAFRSDSKYVLYFDDVAPCVFKGDARQVGIPVQPASSTPTATPSSTPTPVPSRSPTPSMLASPSASASAVAAFAPPVSAGQPPVSQVASYSDKGRVCFPGDAVVHVAGTMAGGDTRAYRAKRMRDVRVGDHVMVGARRTCTVFGFTHQVRDARVRMTRVHTVDNRSLTATHGHFVYAWRGGARLAMRADHVAVGDHLISADGASHAVTRVTRVLKRGLYNPQTLHGDIVVDGFVVSTYTGVVKDVVTAHALLSVWRAVERIMPNVGLIDRVRCAYAPGSYGLCQR